jgi:hypothetical protein
MLDKSLGPLDLATFPQMPDRNPGRKDLLGDTQRSQSVILCFAPPSIFFLTSYSTGFKTAANRRVSELRFTAYKVKQDV